MIHWARLHDAHSLMRVWQHFFAFCLIVTMIKFSERFWWWEACCSGKWQGFDFLASIFSLATRNVRGISRQITTGPPSSIKMMTYGENNYWVSNKYFQFIIFNTISFFQFWPRNKKLWTGVDDFKSKDYYGVQKCPSFGAVTFKYSKIKKAPRENFAKKFGKKAISVVGWA